MNYRCDDEVQGRASIVCLPARCEIPQQKVRAHGRQDDWERGGETFQNVVGVLDHSGDDQTTKSLDFVHK